jgi:hypothetical protein
LAISPRAGRGRHSHGLIQGTRSRGPLADVAESDIVAVSDTIDTDMHDRSPR